MKIAVAFYGIPRSTVKSYPSIESKILSSLPENAEVQIFYHLYDQAEINNKRSGENAPIDRSAYSPFLKHKGLLEVPGGCLTRWEFEKIKGFGDTWGDEYQSLSNLMHQLNSLFEVTVLIDNFDPDVVLFLRPDLIYHDSPSHKIYSFLLKNKSAIFIPAWQWWGGYNDRFSICGKKAYSAYGKRVTQALNFCETQGKSLNSEELVKFAVDATGAEVFPLGVRASRARVDGSVKNELFSSFRGMGGMKHSANLITKKIQLFLAQ